MKNKKFIIILISFLLLVPFRLPIGVLFIGLTTIIAESSGDISSEILAANVVVTKLIYNLVLSSLSLYNIEMLSISIKGRNASEGTGHLQRETIYWWTLVIGILLFCYIIFDTVTTYDLFFELY